jgi:hypothetical protein
MIRTRAALSWRLVLRLAFQISANNCSTVQLRWSSQLARPFLRQSIWTKKLTIRWPVQSDSQLLAQPLRATHVWIAALVEAQESIYTAGQADTGALANATSRLRGNTQPKRAVGTQI